MNKFIASWLRVAAEILGQELSRPVDLLPGAAIAETAATLTLMVDIAGDWCGTFTVTAEESALIALFRPAEVEAGFEAEAGSEAAAANREAWQAVFGRICLAAAADLGASTGLACEVAMISPESTPAGATAMGYQLRAAEAVVPLLILDQVEAAEAPPRREQPAKPPEAPAPPLSGWPEAASRPTAAAEVPAMKGVELLLDIELEASLRFGSREMALSDLLELGPGDVVQLDRALTDPVDLLIGDKIVARGEVVLVNGNFGLQVTEVAEPRKSLESIRCLF